MSTVTEFGGEPRGAELVAASAPRPFYWSVRREVWENRSIYLAPLIVAAVVLFSSFVNTAGVPKRMRAVPDASAAQRHTIVVMPFRMAPAPIMFSTLLVGLFYCLDALYGERRDRSILFWKSLPVSDLTTVLAKASIPLVVLPLVAFALSVITQVLLLLLSAPLFAANGLSPLTAWTELRFFQGVVVMVYGLGVHALWFAPIYGWLMLVSAWARRAPFLWAVVPLIAVGAVQRIAFNSSGWLAMLGYRVTGAMKVAFTKMPKGAGGALEPLSELTPVRFLTTPGLWIGLAFAAACLVIAVRLRRNREPI